jgi:5-methyltetrahydropteroyltriglutamate--homocysteine methyltransferase
VTAPRTTTIGSYPVFPPGEDVEYYEKMARAGVADEVLDPYVWATQEAVSDFAAAGVEVVSTGQTRGDLYSLFLDPRFVKGLEWRGAEAYVTGRLERMASSRLADLRLARSLLPRHLTLKEPVTDAYTLARFAKVSTGSYRDTRDLAKDINRKVVIPEVEDLQKGGADVVQLDSPNLAAESSVPSYLPALYEGVASAARVPLALHACGDTTRIFRFLAGLKVQALELDFYHHPRLLEEVSRGEFDQEIGLGVLDGQVLRVESVDEISALMERARKTIGEDRLGYVHPHCGQRSIDRDTAFRKNANMTMARDDVFFGEAAEPEGARLRGWEADPKGYFLVTVNREGRELVATFYSYRHVVVKRYRSRSAERLMQSLSAEADSLGISRRHLAYLALELGRAEASLEPGSPLYRQRMIQ